MKEEAALVSNRAASEGYRAIRVARSHGAEAMFTIFTPGTTLSGIGSPLPDFLADLSLHLLKFFSIIYQEFIQFCTRQFPFPVLLPLFLRLPHHGDRSLHQRHEFLMVFHVKPLASTPQAFGTSGLPENSESGTSRSRGWDLPV